MAVSEQRTRGLTPEAQERLALEQLRLARLEFFADFVDSYVPSMTAPPKLKPGEDLVEIDTDIEFARNLTLIAAFDVIRAAAHLETELTIRRGKEARDVDEAVGHESKAKSKGKARCKSDPEPEAAPD